jgi:hypothetical protein
MSGLVNCPSCGAEVKLDKPGRNDAAGDRGSEESFSGHETLDGVMEEVEDKQRDGNPP